MRSDGKRYFQKIFYIFTLHFFQYIYLILFQLSFNFRTAAIVHNEKRGYYLRIRQNAEKEYGKDSEMLQKKLEHPKMQRKITGFERLVKEGERKYEKCHNRSEMYADLYMKYR